MSTSDCGCGKNASLLADGVEGDDAAIQELERALDELGGDEPDDLSVALIDDALANEDLLSELDAGTDADLSTILRLLERYPGLKVTLSY